MNVPVLCFVFELIMAQWAEKFRRNLIDIILYQYNLLLTDEITVPVIFKPIFL